MSSPSVIVFGANPAVQKTIFFTDFKPGGLGQFVPRGWTAAFISVEPRPDQPCYSSEAWDWRQGTKLCKSYASESAWHSLRDTIYRR